MYVRLKGGNAHVRETPPAKTIRGQAHQNEAEENTDPVIEQPIHGALSTNKDDREQLRVQLILGYIVRVLCVLAVNRRAKGL